MKQKDWKWGDTIGSIETRYYEAKRQIARNEFVTSPPGGILGALLALYPAARRTTKNANG